MAERIIAHIDMDAFFAAIEERDNPRFKGRPIVIGADPAGGRGRGVVSTASYKAREYGIRSALPISTAWRYAEDARKAGKPQTVFLDVDMKKYARVSGEVISIVRRHAPLVEQASVDEAYLDLSFAGSFPAAVKIVRAMKKEISEKERLTCSVGVGPNKLIAKIASDMQKPDGLTVVLPEETEKFLEPLPIRKIPGIGPKTETELNRLGVKLVRDLKKFSLPDLKDYFGKWGAGMYARVRGEDDSPVAEDYEAKSIGEQDTFAEDTRDPNFITERLTALAAGVFKEFRKSGFKTYRTVVLTVRFEGFITKTKSHTLAKAASDLATLRFEALKLAMPFLDKRENPEQKKIRLVGVRVEKLARGSEEL